MLIKNMMDDLGDSVGSTEVPIPNVSICALFSKLPSMTAQALIRSIQVNESVLKKVIEWCEHHKNDPPATADDDSDSRKKTTDIEEWDQKFMQVDQEMLFEIILVSVFCPILGIPQSNSTSRPPTILISNRSSMLDARPLQT